MSRLQRLLTYLVSPEGEVRLHLDFYKDEVGSPALRGNISADVQVCCQRCMQAMPVKIDSEIQLALRSADRAEEEFAGEAEVLIVEESSMSLFDFVEDETILALPLVAMHEPQECSVKLTSEEVEKEEKPNPFAILATLKDRK